jgi:hypothetical protein
MTTPGRTAPLKAPLFGVRRFSTAFEAAVVEWSEAPQHRFAATARTTGRERGKSRTLSVKKWPGLHIPGGISRPASALWSAAASLPLSNLRRTAPLKAPLFGARRFSNAL